MKAFPWKRVAVVVPDAWYGLIAVQEKNTWVKEQLYACKACVDKAV